MIAGLRYSADSSNISLGLVACGYPYDRIYSIACIEINIRRDEAYAFQGHKSAAAKRYFY